ncbi:hypothetical protein ES703_01620 [subsurface metagenome]
MGAEYNKFAVGAQQASAKVTKAVQAQTGQVAKAAKGVESMGAAARKVKPKMDEFTGGILNITKHLGKWISFNLTWFATWRLMWTALRWLKAGVAAIVDFDTAITALGAITAATQEQLLSLEDTARDVGATTRFTAVEVAEAMVDLSKAGFSVSEVNQMIAGTALLAIGTLSDLTQTTQLVAVSLRTFHLQASEATLVANVFAAAITNSRLTIESLRNSIKYIGPIMAEMGYTIQDTAAVLGVLADRGLEAGISARGLRGFFSALVAPTDKLRRELNRVGLSVRDVTPLTNDLAVILRRLEEANFDVESAMRGLERRVGTTAIALISAGKYFDVLRDAITATTAAQVIAERQVGSLGYRLVLLRSQATELALDFRDLFLPSIQGILSGISALLVAINELTSRIVEVLNVLPPWARQLTIIAGLLLTITTAVGLFAGGLGKGVGLIGLFAAGTGLMYGKIIAGAKAFGIWGLAIAGVIIGLTYLISKIRAAREATTTARKEIAASVFDLGKQRTELARTAIALGEYRDDEIKLRTALEGLASMYPEIKRLLMTERVTYEAAIEVVDKLIESKTEEAKVRRVDLIEAIKAEIEVHKEEIESIEGLQERIKKTWPVLRVFLYIWMLIRHGTLDAGKALGELDKKIKDLELSLRAMEPPARKAAEAIEEYRGPLRMAAQDALDLAKAQGIVGRELIKYIDAAIGELREFRKAQAENLRAAVAYFYYYNKKSLEGLSAQEKWTEALSDPEVKKAYDAWIKAEKGLVGLQKDRREIIEKLYDSLESLREAEKKLWDLRVKRAISEETYLERTLSLMEGKLNLLRQNAEEEGEWTKENATEYIKAQQAGFEAFTKFLGLRLQAALTANKTEQQAIEEIQATWNLWTPYFKKTAADHFEIMAKLKKEDQEWLKAFTIKGTAFLWKGELEKIKKAYIEYQQAMLEFDVAVGRERIQVRIDYLKELLANEEYWQGKEYTARLALEKTLVSLYKTTNKEAIAEAKKLAKEKISLGMAVLTKQLEYLQKEAAAYPVLIKEIIQARKDLLPNITKILKEIDEKIIKSEAVTVDRVVALASREFREKIEFLEQYLEGIEIIEEKGIKVIQESRARITAVNAWGLATVLKLEETFATESIDMEKEKERIRDGIRKLRILKDEAEIKALIELRMGYYDDYAAISEKALEKVEIISVEAYETAKREEEKRFAEAEKRLGEALEKNVMSRENAEILIDLLLKIHGENRKKIEVAYYEFLAELHADSMEKERQAQAQRNIIMLETQGRFLEAEIAQINENARKAEAALVKDFDERIKEFSRFSEEYKRLMQEYAQVSTAIEEDAEAERVKVREKYEERRRALEKAYFDWEQQVGIRSARDRVKRAEEEFNRLEALGTDRIDIEEKVQAAREELTEAVAAQTDRMIAEISKLPVHERAAARRALASWLEYVQAKYGSWTEAIDKILKSQKKFSREYVQYLINISKAELSIREATGENILRARVELAKKILEEMRRTWGIESEEYATALLALVTAFKALDDYIRKVRQARFDFERKLNLKTIDDALERNAKLLAEEKIWEDKMIALRVERYLLLVEKEKLIIEDMVKRGRLNVEIEAELRALWMEHYKSLGYSAAQAEKIIEEEWKRLSKEFKLVADTMEGRWNILISRLYNRIRTLFTDIHPWLRDFGELFAQTFKTATDAAINALTSLFEYWWRGGDRMTRYARDEAQKRLGDIRRELEEEKRLRGESTDRYKELMNEEARVHREVAEAEFALLQERQAVWRNFINAVIKEIMRLIAQMIAMAVIKAALMIFGLGGGGPVPAAEEGGLVSAEMKKGGLVKAWRKRLKSFQKGGEVLIRAHEGEYYIPEPLVKQIRRTREVPEGLVEGIVAGKPPSYQRGGEVGIGERAPATLVVNFQPGTRFTELEKAQTRQYFERTWLPLWREAQRREAAAKW